MFNLVLYFKLLCGFLHLLTLAQKTGNLKIYKNLEDTITIKNPVLTTGTFDGVHLGHMRILNRLNILSNECNGESVLFTFFPHPRMVLFPDDKNIKLLNTQSEKIKLLEQAGVKHLIIFPFTKEFSRLSALEYVRDILVNKIGIKKLVIGYDHHFGRNREGNIHNLTELASLYNFDVEEIPALEIDNINISSTKIRNALNEGRIEDANKLLGYNYMINGIVVQGDKIGRSIGFPTANIKLPDSYKLIPADGVYIVKTTVRKKIYYGMLNIGYKPTLKDNSAKSIEVNLFDFKSEIYNEIINIEFLKWLRNEKKFNALNELQQQLIHDKEQALGYLQTTGIYV